MKSIKRAWRGLRRWDSEWMYTAATLATAGAVTAVAGAVWTGIALCGAGFALVAGKMGVDTARTIWEAGADPEQ